MSNAVLHRPNRIQVSFPNLAPLLYDAKLRTLSEVQQAYIEEVIKELDNIQTDNIYLITGMKPYKTIKKLLES